MQPIVDGLESAYGDRLQVVRLNANDARNRGVLEALRLRGHPTVVVFDRFGKETARIVGQRGEAEVRAAVESALD